MKKRIQENPFAVSIADHRNDAELSRKAVETTLARSDEREQEQFEQVTDIVMSALEGHLAESVRREAPARKRRKMRPVSGSEACIGVSKETLSELRAGSERRGLRLHFEFRPVIDWVTEKIRIADPQFTVVGPHGEGELVPLSIGRIRHNAEFLDFLEKTEAELEREKALRAEVDELNFRLGDAFPTQEVIAQLDRNSPEQARRFFLSEVERQISLYNGYLREFRERYDSQEIVQNIHLAKELGVLEDVVVQLIELKARISRG